MIASSKEWHPCLSYLVGILNWTNRSNVNGFPLYPILSGCPPPSIARLEATGIPTHTHTGLRKPTSYITIGFRSPCLHTSSAEPSHLHSGGRSLTGLLIPVSLSWHYYTQISHMLTSHLDIQLGVMRVWIRKYASESRVQKRETQYVFIVKGVGNLLRDSNKRAGDAIREGNLMF